MSGDTISVIAELEAFMEGFAQDQAWSYEWLPVRVVCSAACLACACMLRPGGKLKDALQFLDWGQRLITDELAAQRVDLEVCDVVESLQCCMMHAIGVHGTLAWVIYLYLILSI